MTDSNAEAAAENSPHAARTRALIGLVLVLVAGAVGMSFWGGSRGPVVPDGPTVQDALDKAKVKAGRLRALLEPGPGLRKLAGEGGPEEIVAAWDSGFAERA